MQNKFYKKGYLIAVYDEEERLQVVCDNVDDFARVYKKPKHVAKSIVHKTTCGKQSNFKHYGESLTIVLIPLDPKEIEELIKDRTA